MADKPEKKPEAAAPAAGDKDKKDGAAKAKGGGLLTKTPVLMGAAMVIEAVVLFGGFKFLGGGAPKTAAADTADDHAEAGHGGDAHGAAPAGKDAKKDKKNAEVQILELRATNTISGRKLLFDVCIVVRCKGEHEELVKQKIGENKALITDRVRTIMAQSDPEKLGGGTEPGLETFRRQVKYQLDDIIGPGIVEEVLVPRCIPFRADL
jgi:flagellar basal body-associated protein FliL